MAPNETVDEQYTQLDLQDMLPIYYKRLFPHKNFYRWLSYGEGECIDSVCCFAFTNSPARQIYCRWKSYRIYASRVFVHSHGWCLHSVFIVREAIRSGDGHVHEESIQNRYRSGDERPTERQSHHQCRAARATWINLRYWYDRLRWHSNMLFRCSRMSKMLEIHGGRLPNTWRCITR